MPKESSIFRAECAALSEALDIASKYPNYNFCIFSDSYSALQSITSNNFEIKKNTQK